MGMQGETIANVPKPIMLGLDLTDEKLICWYTHFQNLVEWILKYTTMMHFIVVSFLIILLFLWRLKTKVAVDHSIPSSNQSMSLKNQPLSRGTSTWNGYSNSRILLKTVVVWNWSM